VIPINPERKAQLEAYARRHGQDRGTAIDETLDMYLELEQLDYNDTVNAVWVAHQGVKAGRARPAVEFLEQLRAKHGFSR
jgi:hypothetical protein